MILAYLPNPTASPRIILLTALPFLKCKDYFFLEYIVVILNIALKEKNER